MEKQNPGQLKQLSTKKELLEKSPSLISSCTTELQEQNPHCIGIKTGSSKEWNPRPKDKSTHLWPPDF